jgi:hypothetical protein
MKIKTFFAALALLAFTSLSAQVEVKLKLEYNASDSTWYFTETKRVDGRKVAENIIPEDKTLTKSQFSDYCKALIQAEQNRLSELRRAEDKALENIRFFGVSVDSVCGPGTAAGFATASIKEKMQGPWSLIARNGETDVYTISIQGDNCNSKDKTSTITWLDAERFRLGTGIFPHTLTFKLDAPDRYTAERTANGVTVKYVIKR